jgi:nitroreductase
MTHDKIADMITRRKLLIGGAGAVVGVGATVWWNVRSMGSMADYHAAARAMRADLPGRPDVIDLLRFAALAANGHNTQPWRFTSAPKRIAILPDFSRRTPVVDPDDHHLYASLGCAAENLSFACAARGMPGELRFASDGDGGVVLDYVEGQAADSPLFRAIPRRQSTRAEFDGSAVSSADLDALAKAAAIPGVDVVLITERSKLGQMRDLVIEGNTAQMADAAFVRELKDWLRFNPPQALAMGDGLFGPSSGNPTLPTWLGPRAFDLVFKPAAENRKYARQIETSAGLAIFVAEKADREHWVLAGRACQRFALQATALGLKHSFVNQPVEVARLREPLAALIGAPGRRPDILMRFGRGPELPFSPRRPPAMVA